MTPAEYCQLRDSEPDLELPAWSEVRHVPATMMGASVERVRSAAIATKMMGDKPTWIPFVGVLLDQNPYEN
jgi:cell wall assembly regulator SMI1